MTKSDLNAYAMRVSQASKTELIVIMYEVAIQYIDDAVTVLEEGDKDTFRQYIKKAKSFINELASVLDMRYPLSHELFRIYTYASNVCVKADARLETEELRRVSGMLAKLKNAFVEVEKQDNSGPLMGNTQQVYAGLTYSRNSLNENYADLKSLNRGFKV